jgi:hypothetical protein
MASTVQHGPAFEDIGQWREAALHGRTIGTRTVHMCGIESRRHWLLRRAMSGAPCETWRLLSLSVEAALEVTSSW